MRRVWQHLGRAGVIAAGALSAGFGLNGFLVANNFIDGGVTGVSMLVAKGTGIPLFVWLPIVNLPFVALGYHQIGRAFAARSVAAIGGLAVAVALVPYPAVTSDRLLAALFGGFFLGAGIGLAVRAGAVLDGTEIGALVVSKRSATLRLGDVILAFNVVLFLAATSMLGIEPVLYSILTYFTAARTLDFVLYGIDEYTAMTIVSDESQAIRDRITRDLGRGVTVYKGYGGMSGTERDILYCVVTRLEVGRVKGIVREADADAFLVFHPLAGAEGGMIRRLGHHH